jgi:hypothetical protein
MDIAPELVRRLEPSGHVGIVQLGRQLGGQ